VFVASGIQHVIHVSHIVTLDSLAEQYFTPLSHQRQDYRKKTLLNIECVLILCTTFAWNISDSKNNWSLYHEFTLVLHIQCLLFFSDFRKMLKYQISWKSIQWAPSCFMRTEGQTDKHNKANSLDGWTEHLAVPFAKTPTNAQGSSGFLLIRSKFSTPTCFGVWLPFSGGRECLISYSSKFCVMGLCRLRVWPVPCSQLWNVSTATRDGS
jgi:hypothetical protein